MKKLFEKIQAMLAAASFAEEGEVETARQILADAGVEVPKDDGHERPASTWSHGAPLAKGTGA